MASAPSLDERLTEAQARDATTVVVDLEQLRFMDSSGLRVLLRHVNPGAGRDDQRFFLTPGPRQVQRLFEVSGVLDHLPFMPSG